MFSLIDYLPEHAVEILEKGAREPNMVLAPENIKFAKDVVGRGPCMTGTYDGQIVSCGGIWKIWEGRGEAWFLCRHDIGDFHINPAIAKEWMEKQVAEHDLSRLEIFLKTDFPEGVLYAEWLGFELEGLRRKYNADRSDALGYVIIKGD